MKYILLASASAFAFAGAAVAEVTFSGSAELGYNDLDFTADPKGSFDDNQGFYWSADLGITLTQELNNGLEAGASVTINLGDSDKLTGDLDVDGDYVLWLTSENAGLYFGATDTAAGKHWSGVSGMRASHFTTDATDHDGDWATLRGDISWGGIDASVSYLVNTGFDDLEQLSVGASGSFGNFNFSLAYQDQFTNDPGHASDDFDAARVYGVSIGTSFGGADVKLAYAKTDDFGNWRNGGTGFDSLGIGVSYPVGPVTLGAYYVAQDDTSRGDVFGITADYASGPIGVSVAYENRSGTADDTWSIEASYDVGNGLTVYAGTVSAGDASYIGGEFDMGNGATLGLSYAEDTNHGEEDEIGAREYQEGATAWVSFTF